MTKIGPSCSYTTKLTNIFILFLFYFCNVVFGLGRKMGVEEVAKKDDGNSQANGKSHVLQK